jgi:Tfp pilus assembly protein PilZ
MSIRQSMMRLLPLLREYGTLERKRVCDGVTPLEYRRWCELDSKLSGHVAQVAGRHEGEPRKHLRVPTRILVEYRTHDELGEAIVSNVSRAGLFISTPFPPEVGTTFVLILRVDATDEMVEVPCEVVSVNLDPAAATQPLGMGVKFIGLGAEQTRAVDSLFAAALGHESLESLITG